MNKFIFAVALALCLAGCASVQTTWNTLTGARVSSNAVYVAANTADSAEVIATAYLRACHKSASTIPACARQVEGQVVNAVRQVRSARNALRAFLVAHPDALGAGGLYDALQQASQALTQLINNYNLAQVK